MTLRDILNFLLDTDLSLLIIYPVVFFVGMYLFLKCLEYIDDRIEIISKIGIKILKIFFYIFCIILLISMFLMIFDIKPF